MSRFTFRRHSDQPHKNHSLPFSFRRPAPQVGATVGSVDSSSRGKNFGISSFKAISAPASSKAGGFMFSTPAVGHDDVPYVSKSTNVPSSAFSFEDPITTIPPAQKAANNAKFANTPKQPSHSLTTIPRSDREQTTQRGNAGFAPEPSEIPGPRIIPFSPQCENNFASPITPAIHTKNVNTELPGSQSERTEKTNKQEKERVQIAESFSQGVAQLSEMNSKMESLKKTVRELTFAATKVHNGILRVADTELSSTISMMKNILERSRSRGQQIFITKDDSIPQSIENTKMLIDETECDPESKTDCL